jgi:hypothetical protein
MSISGVSVINSLVTFYDIHGRRGEVLFFYFVPDTTLFFFLVPPKWGRYTHVFHHVMIKIPELFLRPVACLTSSLLETGVGANDCKCNQEQRLNVPSKARRSS